MANYNVTVLNVSGGDLALDSNTDLADEFGVSGTFAEEDILALLDGDDLVVVLPGLVSQEDYDKVCRTISRVNVGGDGQFAPEEE